MCENYLREGGCHVHANREQEPLEHDDCYLYLQAGKAWGKHCEHL